VLDDEAAKVALSPSQTAASLTVTTGISLTVIVPELDKLEHPFKVYTTTYIDVVEGEFVIDEVVSFPGDHKYVPPAAEGVDVNVADCPSHMVTLLTLTVGVSFTVTVAVSMLLKQPFNA